MTTIKGIYEDGKIKLLEEAPSKYNQKVLITFIDEETSDELRNLSLVQSTQEFKNYLDDTEEDLYQDYLKK